MERVLLVLEEWAVEVADANKVGHNFLKEEECKEINLVMEAEWGLEDRAEADDTELVT